MDYGSTAGTCHRVRRHLKHIAASDLQVVVLGDSQVGFTHPNKIYGAMFLGKPIVYIGPETSHVSDILGQVTGNISVGHGEAEKLALSFRRFAELSDDEISSIGNGNSVFASEEFEPSALIDKMKTALI